MTVIKKRTAFRNERDDATIVVEQYTEPGFAGFLWRYYAKYDDRAGFPRMLSDHLLSKPSRERLKKAV